MRGILHITKGDEISSIPYIPHLPAAQFVTRVKAVLLEPVIEFMPDKISGCPISYRACPIYYPGCRLSNGHPDKLLGPPDIISGPVAVPIRYRAVPILYRDAGYQISHFKEVYTVNFC